MRLYIQYVRMVIRSTLQYPATVWLLTFGQFFVSFFSILAVLLLFQRFGALDNWSLTEVALCFGITRLAFSISECLLRGFDTFPQLVVKGDFDRILLRPRTTILQVLGSGFEITRIGNFIQGALVLAIAAMQFELPWTPPRIFTLILMIAGGAAVFSGLIILGATASFFTVQGLEVVNIFTHGGQEMTSYPLTIYSRWVVRFFTFVIPFGCMNYLPLLYLTGKEQSHPVLYMLIPLSGFLFLLPCVLIWRLGVRHYASTGS